MLAAEGPVRSTTSTRPLRNPCAASAADRGRERVTSVASAAEAAETTARPEIRNKPTRVAVRRRMTGKNEGTPHAVTIRRIGTRRRFWWGLVLGSTLLMGCHSGLQSAEQPRETVEISILTPDAGWQLRVREVRETADAVWVWADLQRPSGPAAQQLTTVSTRVDLPSGKERQVFVTGKTW